MIDFKRNQITLAELEKRAILTVLHQCRWDRAQAASQLGVSVKTIYNKLKMYEAQGCKVLRPKRGQQ